MLTFVLLEFFYQFIAFITILSLKEITGPQDCSEILPVRKRKKVEKHWFTNTNNFQPGCDFLAFPKPVRNNRLMSSQSLKSSTLFLCHKDEWKRKTTLETCTGCYFLSYTPSTWENFCMTRLFPAHNFFIFEFRYHHQKSINI